MKRILRISFAVCLLLALLSAAAWAEEPAAGPLLKGKPAFADGISGPKKLKAKVEGPIIKLSWNYDFFAGPVTGYVVYQCNRVKSKPTSTPFGWYTKRGKYYWYPVRIAGQTNNGFGTTYVTLKVAETGTYCYEVRGYRKNPKKEVSKKVAFIEAKCKTIISQPTSIRVRQTGKNKVELTWKASVNAQKYEIYRKAGMAYDLIGTTKKLKFTDKNVQIGKTYSYKIRAVNGNSTYDSPDITAFPMDKPTSVKASYANGKVTLTWKKVKKATRYRIFEKWTNDSSFREVALVKGTKATLYPSHIGKNSYYVVPTCGAFDGLESKVVVTWAESHYRALLVGNSYSGASNDALPGSLNDVKALSGALRGLTQGWIVNAIQDASANQILSAISSTFSGSTSEDICLFYYSGHGVTANGYYSGALVGNGTPKTYVTPAQLADALNAACGGKVIVLLSSCGSGAMIDGSKGAESPQNFLQAIDRAFSARNRSVTNRYGELIGDKFNVLTACATGTEAWQSEIDGYWCSAFTYSLIRSMGAGFPNGAFGSAMPGDSNGDRKLTLAEAYTSIRKTIQEIWQHDWGQSDQKTQIRGDRMFVLFER